MRYFARRNELTPQKLTFCHPHTLPHFIQQLIITICDGGDDNPLIVIAFYELMGLWIEMLWKW